MHYRDLFPQNAIAGDKEFDWRLTLDHSAYQDEEGLTPQTDKHTEDPDKTTFGLFSMIGAPDQVGNIDKRDGSPYELFDCPQSDEHDKDVFKIRKIRAVCLGDPSSCEEVFFGGIESKLLRVPEHVFFSPRAELNAVLLDVTNAARSAPRIPTSAR